MNRNEILHKYGRKPEDRLLLARLCDRAVQAEKSGRVTHSEFLDPAEQSLSRTALGGAGCGFRFCGGYEGAERAVCLFAPEYIDLSEHEEVPLRALRVKSSGGPLTHRDYLGALMALGIKRETVGDILVWPGGGDIIVMDDIEPYLCYNFKTVGKYACEVSPLSLSGLYIPETAVKTVRETVASLRLDAVLSAAFSLSRSEAAEQIRMGRVSIDHRVCENPSADVKPGALLSLRGSGRARFVSAGEPTRKGRIPIIIEKSI